MASVDLIDIIQRAEQLVPEEQLQIIIHLAEKMRQAYETPKPRRYWHEIRGAAPYPLLGEDAQAWISRTRYEDDGHRQQ